MLSYRLLSAFSKHNAFIIMLLMASFNAESTVNVDKSRVIFSPGDLTANLSLHNSEKEPTMVQLWTDAGDALATPDQVRTPILVNPPVFKMQPREVRNIKLILASEKELPQDRESLFWLNIFQVPPNTNQDVHGNQKIVLPLRLRLKIFIRPKAVENITPDNFKEIFFSLIDTTTLKITNPTKWHITVTSLMIAGEHAKPLLLKPFSHVQILFSDKIHRKEYVTFEVIDDIGAMHQYKKMIE